MTTTAVSERAEAGRHWPKYLPVVATLGLGLLLSALAFFGLRAWVQDRAAFEFMEDAKDMAISIERRIDHNLDAIRTLGGLYAAVGEVQASQFQTFVQPLLAGNPSIQGLAWIPRVDRAERMRFEMEAREDFPDFEITERGRLGDMQPAGERDVYLPIRLVEPLGRNELALGFDLASSPLRLHAAERARDRDEIVASERITFIQVDGQMFGKIVFKPVYRQGMPTATVEQRRQHLRGFVAEGLRVDETVELSLRYLEDRDIDVYVYETTTRGNEELLFFRPSPDQGAERTPALRSEPRQEGLRWRTDLDVADHNWSLVFVPAPGAYSGRAWQPWAALAAGMLYTGLLVAYLGTLKSRNLRIERLAHTLEAEMAHVLRLSTLNELASSLAHEIRQPLAAIANYAQTGLLQMQSSAGPSSDVSVVLQEIAAQTQRACEIIRQLHFLVRKEAPEQTAVDVNASVEQVMRLLHGELTQHKITARLRLGTGIPPVRGNRVQIEQVILNLARNGIEALAGHEAKERKLLLRTEPVEEDTVQVRVCDTGPGISEAMRDRLFESFQSTKPEGMGMGLYISRSIIQAHGGRLWAEANPGGGACFCFTLPVATELEANGANSALSHPEQNHQIHDQQQRRRTRRRSA